MRVDYVQFLCIDELEFDEACVTAPNNFHRIMAGQPGAMAIDRRGIELGDEFFKVRWGRGSSQGEPRQGVA
jgi:hypothetical protein